MSAPSAAVAPAPAANAAAANAKKRKEPSEAEVAQAALLDRVFDAQRSATLVAAAKRMQQSQAATDESPAKKAKAAEEAKKQAEVAAANPFVAAMDAASSSAATASASMTTTANGALTHATTGAPCLDFFFHMARGFPSQSVRAELAAAWAENPETAMRIVMHARDCHGEGKGEKLVAYEALLWLRQHKPRTYLANLLTFVRHGYIKDLVLLADLLDGNAPGPVPRPAGSQPSRRGGRSSGASQPRQEARGVEAARAMWGPLGGPELELGILAEFLRADYQQLRAWKAARGKWRAEQKKSGAKAAEAATPASASAPTPMDGVSFDDAEEVELADLQLGDAEWEQVSGSIEQMEIKDEHMSDAAASSSAPAAASSEPPKQCFVSLAAKWAPSERKHYGSQARRVAALLFGSGGRFASEAAMKGGMRRYRQLLSSLRAHLCVTERLCCSGQWSRIRFEAVPARCHQLLKKAFAKHEPERYAAFLGDVKKGTKQIKVKGLEPHQLVEYYYNGGELNDTVEEAWKGIVARVKEAGTFTRAVALCDVSGSMSGMPMLVSISMGLLIAELTEGAYNGRVMTFDSTPVWHTIVGSTLRDRVNCLKYAPWGGSTDLLANFQLILKVAVENKIPANQMPAKLFIFSDMQFDSICSNAYTNYEAALSAFAAAGYAAPDLVFWNVNGALCADAPVTCERQGVSLMSGFSPMLLNVFLKAPVANEAAMGEEAAEAKVDPMSPLGIMMAAIGDYKVAVHESER